MVLDIDGGPPEQLQGAARLLLSCRDVYLAAWSEGLAEPRAGSQANTDFHARERGPAGSWPDWLAPTTRTMAVRLVRQQVDFCVAVGLLIEAGELFEPIYSMARSAMEFGLRAYWLLEPSATLRQRCARGRLMELVSVHLMRDAVKHRPDRGERRDDLAEMRAGWKRIKASVEEMFNDVDLKDDPRKWSVEGNAYESWSDVAKRWLAAGGTTLSGVWLYKHFSVRAHPQGFNATPGFGVGPDGATTRSTSAVEIRRLARIAAITFYLSMTLVTTYHGLDSPTVRQFQRDVARTFPGVFQ